MNVCNTDFKRFINIDGLVMSANMIKMLPKSTLPLSCPQMAQVLFYFYKQNISDKMHFALNVVSPELLIFYLR